MAVAEQKHRAGEPARRGTGAPASAADDARDLRWHRRPRAPQAPPGDLQPRARGRAAGALQPDRGVPLRDVGRGVPQDGPRVDRAVLATPARPAGAGEAARAGALRGRHVRRGQRLRPARRGARPVRPRGGGRVQPGLLPVDGPTLLRADRQAAGRSRARQAPGGGRARGDREAVRHAAWRRGARSESPGPVRARRVADLPDRPLPREGDGPERPGVPVRERHVRADLEPQLHRLRPDHGGRGHGDRPAGRVLRRRGRAARPRAEPHAPAAQPAVHGAAGDVRRRRGARREGQGAPRRGAARRGRGRASALHSRDGRGQGRGRLPGRGGRAGRFDARRRTSRCGSRSTTGGGRACRSTCAPASGSPARSRRSR